MKVVQLCKFGRNDVRKVKFVASAKKVKVIVNGLPMMIVKKHQDTNKYEASVDTGSVIKFVTARTPEGAYKRGVRRLWN